LCASDNKENNRCRGTIYDLIKLIFNGPISDSYIIKNTDYQYYAQSLQSLQNRFNQFTQADWHNTNFWSTLDLSRVMIEYRQIPNFDYTSTSAWTNQNLRTAAGALFNIQMPIEQWVPFFRREIGTLEDSRDIVKYNFIEPNLYFANELLANTHTLFKTLYSLGLIKENDVQFKELIGNLVTIKKIINKELFDQEFSFDDWQFLNDLVGQYYISQTNEKTVKRGFVNPETNKEYYLQQSLANCQLLVEVQNHQNRQVIVVGPIFNYQEVKK